MANRPKGKLFALLAIFVAIGLVTASGAFTSVQAERTMNVDVAGDASALLQLEDAGQGYVDTSGDVVQIDITGDGLNINASTDLGAVLNVTNNAGETINVQIATQQSQTSFANSNLIEDDTSLDPSFEDSAGTNIEGGDATTGGNQLSINSGQSADVHLSITIPAGETPQTFNSNIVIVASTDDLTA